MTPPPYPLVFRFSCAAVLLLGSWAATPLEAWRSTLYPTSWTPPGPAASISSAFLQDFSYAGYRRSEAAWPTTSARTVNVVSLGADPTGSNDSTDAIQAAIDSMAAAGGGEVYLPAGLYRLSARGDQCLWVRSSRVVLRGDGATRTFLWNTSVEMRSKAILRVGPTSVSESPAVRLSADLTGPTTIWRVAETTGFAPGQIVILRWDFSPGWIAEHGQGAYWSAPNVPLPANYRREVLEVNAAEGWIRVDIPNRFPALVRDDARLTRVTGLVAECGVVGLAFGNTSHPGTGFGEEDYSTPGTAAYDVHASWAIALQRVYDCWLSDVASFAPAGNPHGAHLVSNGVLVANAFRVTVQDASFGRTQYGGGGGNGYMVRLQDANECLVRRFTATFSRHGLVLSHAGATGNVFRDCVDRTTKRAVGDTGSYETGGQGSDHHMHFSHSNLLDGCLADDSFFAAFHREYVGGGTPHGLTGGQTVFWNTRGQGTRYTQVINSSQLDYGYIIGTSGTVSAVKTVLTNPGSQTTAPEDFSEGLGQGASLEPASLYDDQWQRRVALQVALAPPPPRTLPAASATLSASLSKLGTALADFTAARWEVVSGPAGHRAAFDSLAGLTARVTADLPGTYRLRLTVERVGETAVGETDWTVAALGEVELPLEAVADAYIRSGTFGNDTYGTATEVWLKYATDPNFFRHSLFRFDLAPLAGRAIRGGRLRLVSTRPHAGATATLGSAATNWSEATVTWNNAPALATPLHTFALPGEGETFSLDVSAPIVAAAGGAVGFRLRLDAQNNANDVPRIAAREHPDANLRPTLLVQVAPSTFAQWVADWPQLGAATAPENDPDGDLLTNLVEAFFGTTPHRADGPALRLASSPAGSVFDVTVNRFPPSRLSFVVETNPTLAPSTWRLATAVEVEDLGADAFQRHLRLHLPEAVAQPLLFVRLRVSLSP